MKHFGFAICAAIDLSAMVASPASATQLCSTAGTGTACGTGHGGVFSGKFGASNIGNIVFTITNNQGEVLNTVTATSSSLSGEISSGATGVGKITQMTFAGISSSICSSVTMTTSASTSNPWPLSVATETAAENTNGIISWEGATRSFTCTFLGFPVTCKYRAAKVESKLDGSDVEPKLTISQAPLEKEEGNETVCGAKEDFTATYKITTPSSLFVE